MKKGFTLTEMLAVIIILGLIIAIAYPVIISSISGYRNDLYISQVSNIEDAAKSYVADHIDFVDCKTEVSRKIQLDTLIDEGYINDSLIDPTTNAPFSSKANVKVRCVTIGQEGNYKYSYKFNKS